jgi:hypothetical protein
VPVIDPRDEQLDSDGGLFVGVKVERGDRRVAAARLVTVDPATSRRSSGTRRPRSRAARIAPVA